MVNEITAVSHKLDFRFQVIFKKNQYAFKVGLVRFDYKDLSVSGPEETGSIVTYEKGTVPLKITKQRAQSLRAKMRKAELYLKGATVKYLISLQLAGRLPELALRKD